jgi:hypothetical protein
MNQEQLGKSKARVKKAPKTTTYARPSWVPQGVVVEEELYSNCFKVVACVQALSSEYRGHECVYRPNQSAHYFEECKIPF